MYVPFLLQKCIIPIASPTHKNNYKLLVISTRKYSVYIIIHPNSTYCRNKPVHMLYSVKEEFLVTTTNAVIKLIASFNIWLSFIKKLTSLCRNNLIGPPNNRICDSLTHWNVRFDHKVLQIFELILWTSINFST